MEKAGAVVWFLSNYASMQVTYSSAQKLALHLSLLHDRPLTSLYLGSESPTLLDSLALRSGELESLELSFSVTLEQLPSLRKLLGSPAQLLHLTLNRTALPTGQLYASVYTSFQTSLQELALYSLVFADRCHEEMVALGNFVNASSSLSKFSLTCCHISEASFDVFARSAGQSNSLLRSLTFGNLSISHFAAVEIASFFGKCKMLTAVMIKDCTLCPDALHSLFKAFARSPTLKSLYLRHLELVGSPETRIELALAESYSAFKNVETLYCGGLSLSVEFYMNVRFPISLFKFALCTEGLRDDTFAHLIEQCKPCHKLLHLLLSNSNFGGDSCRALMGLLLLNRNLHSLAVETLQVSESTMEDVLRTLTYSPQLEKISIRYFAVRKGNNGVIPTPILKLAKRLKLRSQAVLQGSRDSKNNCIYAVLLHR